MVLTTILRRAGAYKLYERYLRSQLAKGPIPQHVGIILDGNRRWAQLRQSRYKDGHVAGADTAEKVLDWCVDLGIRTLTLYVLSAENLQRSPEEVSELLNLIDQRLTRLSQDQRLERHKVRVKGLGKTELLPGKIKALLSSIEEKTADHDQHFLNIAMAYGGRLEIVDVVRSIAARVKSGELDIADVDQGIIEKNLYTAHLPNPEPDLIIRTSGEERLSGFLLWQSAYSELVFLDAYWPDFRKIDVMRAIRTYQHRVRKFGR